MTDTRVSARAGWPILALALGAIAVSLLARHLLFPAYSWNRDETVYLWQVSGLRAGEFTSTTGGFPSAFHPWLAGIRGHSFFSQYTLGWPLVLLAADVGFGSPDGALALGTALTVVGTYLLAREIIGDPRTAFIAGALMLLSPIVIIQSGIYLGYLFTLGLGLLFATVVLSGFRTGRYGRLVLGGGLVGWIFITRPFDAVLWTVAVVGTVAWSRRREPQAIVRAAVALGIGFAPLLVATLAYNRHVTGSFGQFPITAADPLDTFGFGARRIMPTFHSADYTVIQAFRSSAKQAFLLPFFMMGSYVLAAVAGSGLWRGRKETGTRLLVAIMVAFPVGYFFFWGVYVSSATMPLSGPIYFIPLYAVIAIAGAAELRRLWIHRRRLARGLVITMVIVTIPVALDRIDVNRRISEAQLPWKRSSAAVAPNSLVFVWRSGDYLMFLNPYSANRPHLDGPVVYAADLGAHNLDVIAAFPRRTPYLQVTSLAPNGEVPNDHPKTPSVTLLRIRVTEGAAAKIDTKVVGARSHGLSLYASLRGKPVRVNAGPRGTVRLDPQELGDGTGTLTVGVGHGANAAAAARNPVTRQDIHFRVADGRISVITPVDTLRRRVVSGHRHWVAVPPGVKSPVSLATVVIPLRK